MNHDELLALLEAGEAPETVYDDLRTMYGESNSLAEGAGAKVTEMEAVIAELQAQIDALKGQNYDLLMASKGTPAAEDEAPAEEDGGDEPEDYDDLFTNEDED